MTHPVGPQTRGAAAGAASTTDSTVAVSLFDIFPNPWNPHKMTEDEQNELIKSVKEDGQWRPILVVEMDVPDDYTPTPPAKYRIVDGFHLWTALCALNSEGVLGPDPLAKIMVIGLNSHVDIVRQMDIGQTMNHGLRGSIEDPVKTQEVLSKILTRRPPEEVARRMNIGTAGVRHLSDVPVRKPGSGIAGVSGMGTLGSAVQHTPYAERKQSTLALVFNTADEMKQFDQSLELFAGLLDEDTDYTNRRGQRRIDILKALLIAAQLAGLDGQVATGQGATGHA